VTISGRDSSRIFLNYNGPDFGEPRENHSALDEKRLISEGPETN
jgi:hypothetical protein